MKKSIVMITAFFIGFVSFGQKKKDLIQEIAQLKAQKTEIQLKLAEIQKAKALNLEDSLQSFSYAFGVSIGDNLKAVGFDSLASNAFAIALDDVMNGKEKIRVEDAQRQVQSTIKQMQDKEAKERGAKGELFLAENAKRSEISSTASGLQYEVLKKGDGPVPTVEDKVKVHYTGMLTNGKVFDSSVERGEPITFAITGVIKGWTEALQLMPVGSKWKVYIPQDLAYGQRGAGGGEIPPYATLIFEMELLAIEK